MNEDYENKDGFGQDNNTDGNSYYGRYTDGGSSYSSNEDGAGQSYAYKTVMDGVPRSRGWSVASLVLGILSIVCCCVEYGGLIMGILAIVFSIISRRNLGYFDGMAIAGLITGMIGAVFGIAMLALGLYLNANPEILESYMEYLESIYGESGEGLPGINDGF